MCRLSLIHISTVSFENGTSGDPSIDKIGNCILSTRRREICNIIRRDIVVTMVLEGLYEENVMDKVKKEVLGSSSHLPTIQETIVSDWKLIYV